MFGRTSSDKVRRVDGHLDTPADVPLLRRLARRSAPFDGCISRAHLLEEHIDYHHVRSLVRRAALTQVLTRVFVTGGVESISHAQLEHAALLNGGSGARLCRWSALAVHGAVAPKHDQMQVSLDRPSSKGVRELTTLLPVRETNRPASIEVFTPRASSAHELVRGLPVEPIAVALCQIAADASDSDLMRAWREADFLGLIAPAELGAQCRSGVPGARRLGRLLAAQPPIAMADRFRSCPEYLLLEAMLALGTPRPLVNANVEFGGRYPELDFFLVDAQLNVEVDGPQHRLPARRREDEERDAFLRTHGVEVLRFPHAEVEADAAACASVVEERRLERIAEGAIGGAATDGGAPAMQARNLA
ncbi:MAG: DUF559 domain-containing protein [Patulibacter minatonensis]